MAEPPGVGVGHWRWAARWSGCAFRLLFGARWRPDGSAFRLPAAIRCRPADTTGMPPRRGKVWLDLATRMSRLVWLDRCHAVRWTAPAPPWSWATPHPEVWRMIIKLGGRSTRISTPTVAAPTAGSDGPAPRLSLPSTTLPRCRPGGMADLVRPEALMTWWTQRDCGPR